LKSEQPTSIQNLLVIIKNMNFYILLIFYKVPYLLKNQYYYYCHYLFKTNRPHTLVIQCSCLKSSLQRYLSMNTLTKTLILTKNKA